MNQITHWTRTESPLLAILICLILMQACAPLPSQLPTTSEVPQSESLVIDGVWRISTNKKRIRIASGRAYSLDSWLHLGIVQIKPDEVLIQNLRQQSPGVYQGYDLPLQGGWLAELQSNGTLQVTVNRPLGAIKYDLIPDWLDDQEAFDQVRTRH